MNDTAADPGALTINSLGDLQLALLEDDNSAINNYIERLDRETSNEAFKKCGQQFDFPVVEVEGVFRTSGNHLARVFGYKRSDFLKELLDRRGIFGIEVGGFRHDAGINIRETLNLSPQDRRSILYDWPAFLIGGMNSQNPEARMVQAYLLRMEKIARVGIVATRDSLIGLKCLDAATGAVICNLAKEAWRGNAIAAHVLEQHYSVPALSLLAEKDFSGDTTTAELISRYFQALLESDPARWGIEKGRTDSGAAYLQGRTANFSEAFTALRKEHKLPGFFTNTYSLGIAFGREARALESLGWLRSRVGKYTGFEQYRFEQITGLA